MHYVLINCNDLNCFQWLSPLRDTAYDPFIQGIIRSASRLRPPKQRQIVTLEILSKISGYRDVGVALLSMILYAALLRISEAVALKWSDCVVKDNSLAIVVRKAKNDQLAKGRTTYIPFGKGSKIRTLWNLWSVKNNQSRYLFPSNTSDNRHIPRSSASRRIKKMLTELGHPDLSTHSFRAGAATNEAARGVSILQLQRRGRWKSTRGMEPYIRDSLQAQGGHTELAWLICEYVWHYFFFRLHVLLFMSLLFCYDSFWV